MQMEPMAASGGNLAVAQRPLVGSAPRHPPLRSAMSAQWSKRVQRIRLDGSSRDVGDHGVEQRRAHRGHANAPALVEVQETVFDQAANPLGVDQAAADLLKRPGVDAFAQAQAHQQEFVALLLAAERLVLDEAVALGLDLGEPHFRMPLGLLRASPLRRDEAPMRARTDARIFAVAPIDEIVPALGARPRVIGDFVGRQTMRLGDLLRRVEQGAAELVVGQVELARVA